MDAEDAGTDPEPSNLRCPLTWCAHSAVTANELCGHIVRTHQVNMFHRRGEVEKLGVTDEFEDELRERLGGGCSCQSGCDCRDE